MRILKLIPLLFLLLAIGAGLAAEPSGRSIRFHMKHPMKSIDGRCDDVTFSAAPALRREGDAIVLAAPVSVTCPVASLHTGDANRDGHAYEALRYPKHQAIVITLSEGKCTGQDCTMSGTLTVAGVTKPLQMKAKREESTASTRIHGTHIVKMTDHGIAPPSLLFLAIEDAVVVAFDFSFAK